MTIETVVIGARGYTGSELLPLLYHHPACTLRAVGSSSAAGELLNQQVRGLQACALRFTDIRPGNLHQFPADLYVLALPNGHAADYVEVATKCRPEAVIIDLSADYRFDDAWVYGQPEQRAQYIAGARRIANPGCYATGAQLALAPLVDRLASTPVVFGVSGFSGAGKTPSRRNDPEVLKDNILPYVLADHLHEQEISRQLGCEVRFMPHVAPFFRGISLTVAAELDGPARPPELFEHFRDHYSESPLIKVQEEIPEVTMVRGTHGVIIGGFTSSRIHPRRLSLVCVLDNLLKGAATQVVQNMNLAFGQEPLAGLDSDWTAQTGKSQ
jgi:N-acetyl-gamma-glutamyl-phosphate reductase